MVSVQSTFRLKLRVPARVNVRRDGHARDLDRESFYGWLWEEFGEAAGLVGVHEGTVLSAEAAERGLETESFTVDAAEAPRERDWVGGSGEIEAELYFSSQAAAEGARVRLRNEAGLSTAAVEEQPPEDWDAIWKASFTGISIPPHWEVVPPWREPPANPVGRLIRLNPGAGFGTGTHETTQLCLELLADDARIKQRAGRVLDFGSGSGILAIGAALLGSSVRAVEIDELAIDNAIDNARLNGIESAIDFSRALRSTDRDFELIVANILKPVLLEFAADLNGRLARGGRVILSGLVEADVKEVSQRYSALLGRLPSVRARGEWRALYWA